MKLKEPRLQQFCFILKGKILKIIQRCFNVATFNLQFLKIELINLRFLKAFGSRMLWILELPQLFQFHIPVTVDQLYLLMNV